MTTESIASHRLERWQEEARQQRLRELQDILENERDDGHGSESGGTNPIDPIDPSEDKRVKKNRSAKRGKNRGNNRAGGLPSEKISSSRTTNIYESDSEEDEDEDEQTLCIVCMVEKRNACLVHGKTSHQVHAGADRGCQLNPWMCGRKKALAPPALSTMFLKDHRRAG